MMKRLFNVQYIQKNSTKKKFHASGVNLLTAGDYT